MTLPTVNEVTALYLYGSTTVPSDKTDPTLQFHSAGPPLQINRTDFMTNGPGRFGGPAQIDVVQKFFDGWLDVIFEELGPSLTLSQILANAEQRIMQVNIAQSISQLLKMYLFMPCWGEHTATSLRDLRAQYLPTPMRI